MFIFVASRSATLASAYGAEIEHNRELSQVAREVLPSLQDKTDTVYVPPRRDPVRVRFPGQGPIRQGNDSGK